MDRRRKLTSARYLQDAVRDLEASVIFFGAGGSQQQAAERWVVRHFLIALGIEFTDEELHSPPRDPPDIAFRDAAFEVKEIGEVGRRRHDEYREALARAKAATTPAELLEQFTMADLPIATVYERILAATATLATHKYSDARTRRGLDLLFYVNLNPRKLWTFVDGDRPDVSVLAREGWRSVSFLHGDKTSRVIYASDRAPPFLRTAAT